MTVAARTVDAGMGLAYVPAVDCRRVGGTRYVEVGNPDARHLLGSLGFVLRVAGEGNQQVYLLRACSKAEYRLYGVLP